MISSFRGTISIYIKDRVKISNYFVSSMLILEYIRDRFVILYVNVNVSLVWGYQPWVHSHHYKWLSKLHMHANGGHVAIKCHLHHIGLIVSLQISSPHKLDACICHINTLLGITLDDSHLSNKQTGEDDKPLKYGSYHQTI